MTAVHEALIAPAARVCGELAPTASRSSTIADLAVRALITEATLTPKPGLVDLRGGGAHRDMTVETMLDSAEALRDTFAALADAGRFGRPGVRLRELLAEIGRDGETAMFAATGGVNTHRGAIWALGLVAAAAADPAAGSRRILARAAAIAAFDDRSAPHPTTPGSRVRAQFNVPGAIGEARAGFPHASVALDILRARRAEGHSDTVAHLDALLGVVSTLDDTCLLNRGGLRGLRDSQFGARAVLDAGGVSTPSGALALEDLDAHLTESGLSPGGSADLLALAVFLDSLDADSHDADSLAADPLDAGSLAPDSLSPASLTIPIRKES